MTRSNTPRRLAAPRVLRYDSWKALQAAVLDWCRARVRNENPTFDVARLEQELSAWVQGWASDGDAAHEHYSNLQSSLVAADEFLKANPRAAERSLFAAMLEGFLSARVEGHDGGFGLSVRERLAHWRPIPKAERWPLGSSPRARLVALFGNAPPNVLWWTDRTPEVRDLAIISMLAGQWPDAARKAQTEGKGAARPTVMDVVRAEENAIRATLRHRVRR